MYRTANSIMHRFGWLRRIFNRVFYQYLSSLDQPGDVTLMNYGYQSLDPQAPPIPMSPSDEDDRYSLQLYHHVASGIDIAGLDVLEVGSGRGGGASYMARTFAPASLTGIDYSSNAVAFCQQHYDVDNLRFLPGDAEDLPFVDAQFDVVVNVESSHCYGSMAQFLREVKRVLRPGGHLLWADLRPPAKVAGLFADIAEAGFSVLVERTITPNVLSVMSHQGQRNRRLIDRRVPAFARWIFYNFAGVEGTYIYNRLESGELLYLSLVLQANS